MSVEMSFGDFSILNFGAFLKPAIGMGLLDGGVPIYLGTALFWVYLGGSEFLFGRPDFCLEIQNLFGGAFPVF